MTAPVVAPLPAAVVELLRVVQDAAAQRRLRTSRVVLHRASEQRLEAGEALRSVTKSTIALVLRPIHARGDVDHHERPHQMRDGARRAPSRSVHRATSRRPGGRRRELRDRRRRCRRRGSSASTHRRHANPSDRGRAGRSATRTSERQDRRVPRVGVLRAAVDEHDLGVVAPPPSALTVRVDPSSSLTVVSTRPTGGTSATSRSYSATFSWNNPNSS